MRVDLTREVVSDLWSLCRAGEASAASRALVEAYLATDRELAVRLEENDAMSEIMPKVHLSPEAERRLLDEAQLRARQRLYLTAAGIALAALLAFAAFGGLLWVFAAR